jgi:VWFA-related protein
MRIRLTLAVSVAIAATLTAQSPQNQPTFRSGVNYVRVDMYATRDGKPVTDLQITDVDVLEDGVPQKIEAFEHVVVRSAGNQSLRADPPGLRESREAAADPRARVFVIFLDTYHTQLDGSANMRKPLVAFLDRVLGDDDLVALMTPEMAGSDIALGRKTAVIEKIVGDEWWGRRDRVAGKDPKDLLYEECVGGQRLPRQEQDRLLAEMIGRRRELATLNAMEDLLLHLGGLREERKAVVMVTEGWLLYEPNPNLAAQLTATTGPAKPPVFQPPVLPPSERGLFTDTRQRECEADVHALAALNSERMFRDITEDANRGNVTFYPVYARGLSPFDAPIGPDIPPSIRQDMKNLSTRHDSMRTLAVETDGEAIINTNNIEQGLRRIADDLSSYYLLGYYSSNNRLDGRFRSITVRVKQPNVRVRARRGYRARTAEQVAAAATAGAVDRARTPVTNALNAVAAVSSRSVFRVRPAAWTRAENGSSGGTVWVTGELDFRTAREPGWTAGGRAEIMLLGADGGQLAFTRLDIPAGQRVFAVRLPVDGQLAPGDYAVRIRLRGGDTEESDTARVIIPEQASAIGEAVLWRRNSTSGTQYLMTADPRYQRSDRLRLEHATAAAGTTARLLDRAGKPLPLPLQVSERADAAGIRWVVVDLTLAPLATGDYAVEVAAGGSTQITAFRIIP